jgi:hypothetical protein
MEKRKVEIFTAGCPVCEPVVEQVKSMVCRSCEVIVYNLSETNAHSQYLEKVKKYNINSLPAVAVDGQLLACCSNRGVSIEELQLAGIGKPLQ